MLLLWCLGITAITSSTSSFDPFEDSINFEVAWGDPNVALDQDKESISMVTSDAESYTCKLPTALSVKPESSEESTIKAREIIGKLGEEKACSYRVDSYWIYEVCHGRHIKQFHEERDVANKKLVTKQEFYLGYAELISYQDVQVQARDRIPTMSHAGALRPYYPVFFKGGTECDLKPGFKRQTTVFYMCMPDFQTSVVSVKETTTCEYEIVIYTSILCRSAAYRLQEDPINRIYCYSEDGQKWKQPQGYGLLDEQYRSTLFEALSNYHTSGDGTAARGTDVRHPKMEANSESSPPPRKSQLTFPERAFVKRFLSGTECVIGGTGWWKYEFCFMRHIKQFHMEKTGKKTEVLLGVWDEAAHTNHVAETQQDVGNAKTYLDLYFFRGSVCDQTGVPRQTKVRLRCSKSGNVQAITMFLEEPSVCKYHFTAESALFCGLMGVADGIPRISDLDGLIEQL